MPLTREQQRKVLIGQLGSDRVVRREANYLIRNEKGKIDKDKAAAHDIQILESYLPKCLSLTVGVSAFGKGTATDVLPDEMEGLGDANCLEAIAAANPKLTVKSVVTSAEAQFTDEAAGQILADHLGSRNGADEIAAARIELASKLGLHGKPLSKAMEAIYAEPAGDDVEEPANEPVLS